MKAHVLTEGKISKQLLLLTLPLLAGNMIQQFYNTVDMVIVGKFVGDNAFASIGICGSVINLFTCILIGLNMGFSILYANHYGAQDFRKLRQTIFATNVIGICASLLLCVVGILFVTPILNLMQTPEELLADCEIYLFWVFLGLLFAYFYNGASALLRAIGKTDITLWVLLAAMVMNITMDYTMVAVLHWGVWGAALATVLSQGISALFCYGYLWWYHPELRLSAEDRVYSGVFYQRAFSFGSVSALQQSSVFFGKLLVQGAINTMGTAAIQAYTAAVCIESLLISFGDSGSAALSIFIAQNCGVGDAKRVQQGYRKGMTLMMGSGVILMLLLFLWRRPLLSLLISAENTVSLELAAVYLLLMCFFLPESYAGNIGQGYYRGIGRVKVTFCASMIQIITRVILTYALVPVLLLNGVAVACGVGWSGMILYHWFCFNKYGYRQPNLL